MYLLGFDIGSSSIKAALVSADSGETVAIAKFPKQEMPIQAPQLNWAEQDPYLWWKYICEASNELIEQTNIDANDIKGIGISYQMHGLVLIDEYREPLRDAIIWCDSRAVEIGKEAFEEIGERFCLENLLNSPGNFTASKLKWVKDHEPELYNEIYKIMLPGDFIAMKMTDKIYTTPSGLSEGIFWDFNKNELSNEVLDYFGFSPSYFPTIVDSISNQGELTQKAANEMGLVAGIPIGYRAGDQPNNALSLGVLEPGEIAATGGTSGVVYGVTNQLTYDQSRRINSFAHVNHTAKKHSIGVLLCINGAGIMNSWIKNIAGKELSYTQINELASSVEIGSEGLIVLPFGNGAERVLQNKNIGGHIAHLNLNIHQQKHLFRATLEGIAFSFIYGIEILKSMGMDIKHLKVGNDNLFQSDVFAKTIATFTNTSIEIIDTTGAVGAAKASGVTAGIYANLKEAMQTINSIKTIQPDLDKAPYTAAYHKWKETLRNHNN